VLQFFARLSKPWGGGGLFFLGQKGGDAFYPNAGEKASEREKASVFLEIERGRRMGYLKKGIRSSFLQKRKGTIS